MQFADWQQELEESRKEAEVLARKQAQQAREAAERMKISVENAWIKRKLDTDTEYRERMQNLKKEEEERIKLAQESEEYLLGKERDNMRKERNTNPLWHGRREKKERDAEIMGPSMIRGPQEKHLGD